MKRSSRPGTKRNYGISTIAPTTPSTCSTARPWPTAARGTPKASRRHDGEGTRGMKASRWSTSSAPRPATTTRAEAKAEINRRIDSIAERRPRPGARQGSASPPGHCVITARSGSRSTAWSSTGSGRGSDARPSWIDQDEIGPEIKTKNISALTLTIPSGDCPFGHPQRNRRCRSMETESRRPSHSPTARGPPISGRSAASGQRRHPTDDGTLRKRHGLQGPIDDAFMDSFMMVRPTGPALNERWASGQTPR